MKKIIIVLLIFIPILAGFLYFCFPPNEEDTYLSKYPIKDNDYLKTRRYEIRTDFSSGCVVNNTDIYQLVLNVLDSSYKNNKKVPDELINNISLDVYTLFDHTQYNYYKQQVLEGSATEDYSYNIFRIKYHKDKAIVEYHFTYISTDIDSNSTLDYSRNADDMLPVKVYLSYVDGTWIIEDTFCPA